MGFACTMNLAERHQGSDMYVGCLTYIAVSTSPKEKPQYLGLVGLIWYDTVLTDLSGWLILSQGCWHCSRACGL